MKIALVYPDDFSLWHFHRDLLTALKAKGLAVYAISTHGEYVKHLESLGVVHIPVKVHRFISPIADLRLLIKLYRIFRAYHFGIVHTFTIKANIYGAAAAKLARVKRIVGTAEGLGFMFSDHPGLAGRLLGPLVRKLYKLSCALTHKFWFVNPDDLELFISRGIIAAHKAVLTISAGVNLGHYSASAASNLAVAKIRQELGIGNSTQIVAMIVARIVWSKGIREFSEASGLLRRKYPSVEFIVVGATEDSSPESVPAEYLRDREKAGNFKWLGFRKDIREIYAASELVVLPSYYREGVPNVLLEAMALGKPVVTTNNVGCKEAVEHGRNGYLVPVRDSQALARAIEALITDSQKRETFGRYGRRKAEREFDKKLVIDRIVRELYEIA